MARIALHIVFALALAGDAWADPEPVEGKPETIVISPTERSGPSDLVGSDPEARDAARQLDSPAFVSVVHVDERAGEVVTAAEVLAEAVGVDARSLGGLGGFSSVSIRGGASGNTAVLIDGVELSRLGAAGADLGQLDLASYSEMEVYRGGVPSELVGTAMSGALNLVTRIGVPESGKRFRLSAGAGSFGARHLRARWVDGTDDGARAMHVAASYAGAEGDFSYFDDNGTNLNPDDDAFVRRQNNGYDRVDTVVRYRDAEDRWTVELGGRSHWQQQQIPGTASVQSTRSNLTTFRQIADGRVTLDRALGMDSLIAGLRGYGVLEHQRYRDRLGEIGLAAQDRRYLTATGGAGGFVTWRGSRHRVSGTADLRADSFSDVDITGQQDLERSRGSRWAVAVSARDEISVSRVYLEPSLRLDVQHTEPISDIAGAVTGPMELSPRTDVYPSPRISSRLRVARAVSLKANAGLYFRAPTTLELFGDRGFIVGNPSLLPERGIAADAGIVVAPRRAHGVADRVYLEAAAFGSRPQHVIALVPNAGLVTGARNLGDALIGGVELAGTVRVWRAATVSGNYTLLETRQQSSPIPAYEGKRLPQRPRHRAYIRIDLARRVFDRLAAAWVDASLTSDNFLDPANLEAVPARRLFGAGIKIEPLSGVLLGLEAKNLSDARVERVELSPAPRPDLTSAPQAVTDFFGYPLPGRAFYLTLDLEI